METVTLPALQKGSGRARVRVTMTGAVEQSAQIYHRDREGSIEHLSNTNQEGFLEDASEGPSSMSSSSFTPRPCDVCVLGPACLC